MKTLGTLIVGLALAACGPTHSHRPYVEVGTPLALTVDVPKEHAADASAQVHYRMPAATGYETAELARRGPELYVTLDTEGLQAGQAVAYYFDVVAGGELTLLRSPDNPYVTRFVSRDELILRSLSVDVGHDGADDDVTFELHTGDIAIDAARVVYQPPDLAGHVTQPMQRLNGGWKLIVPADRVAEGLWRYSIEADLRDRVYVVPGAGAGHFQVKAED